MMLEECHTVIYHRNIVLKCLKLYTWSFLKSIRSFLKSICFTKRRKRLTQGWEQEGCSPFSAGAAQQRMATCLDFVLHNQA